MKKLRLLVETENGLIGLEKEIDYTPSKGLIIYEPIYGTIGTVVYDKGGFLAMMETVIEPTSSETVESLLSNGWKEYKL